ncbi:type I-E CRISPR-associated protein Cse1/CasA [Rhodococcus qingshengii]|uniref:type I-E CRISPR-associated protein Cse1/CasA n=1 Tax=Rhodococcus qingshengii TaxID=334542 RepID=UPI001F148723|nr:type I-E CRISPR-associated protein Cse1/CasA [Rhodococcus qingshengii]ULD39028.1 type I-E CRISPR-associated protein Cse1/CasA [Rhodococcus qingshengii]
MNLLTEPWIDVFTLDGPQTLSLAEIVVNRGDIVDVASADPLEDAAILRILMAIDLASEGDPINWLHGTAGKWNLFDTAAPFWQNTQLREHVGERTVSPAVTLSYRYAGNGTVLLDHRHNESQTRLTPVEATRALMMRQQFSVGGIQSFPETIFKIRTGPKITDLKGLKSAKAAIAAPRPFAWIDAGNLADTLIVNRRPGPIGTFHHSWPGGNPGDAPDLGGQADALTWQGRSVLLIPDLDGYVTGISMTDGLRYGEDTDPQLLPHTTFKQKKAGEPFTTWDVHADRPAWRQLLAAYAAIDAPGVLAADLPADGQMRLAGLASFQSRIDGPVTGSLPVPTISRGDVAVLGAGVDDVRKYVVGRVIAGGRVLAPSSTPTSPGAWWKRNMPTDSRMNSDMEPIVRRALTGEITLVDAIGEMYTLADTVVAEFSSTIAQASPIAAAVATTPPAPKKEAVS